MDEDFVAMVEKLVPLYRGPRRPEPCNLRTVAIATLHRIQCRCRDFPYPTALILLGLAVLWSLQMSPDRNVEGFSHLFTMPFYPMTIVAGMLGGRPAAWSLALGALAIEAIVLPPTWSFAIDAQYLSWFGDFVMSLTVTAFCASFFPAPPPVKPRVQPERSRRTSNSRMRNVSSSSIRIGWPRSRSA